jgi:glycosyltransferase involved in cell wall biosynthesis
MSTLSACLIAKNEEAWLGDCLKHLQSIVDEIIVVDTGSTDRTKEIALSYGAKLFEFPWINDFSAARNFSLEKATKEWILVMDPDERLAERDLKSFKELTLNKDAEAYAFYCRNYVRNPKITGFKNCKGEFAAEELDYPGYVENSKVFLFRNLPHIRFTGVVHENVVECVKDNLIASDIPFHHYGYSPEVNAAKDKRHLYRSLGEEKLKMNPTDWYANFELGVEYLTGNKVEEAVALFEKANELQPHNLRVLTHLSATYLKLDQLNDAEAAVMKCLSVDGNNLESASRLGVIWIRQNHLEKAEQLFDKLISDFPPNYLCLKNAALCAAKMKKAEKAIGFYQTALAKFENIFDCWMDYAFQFLHTQQFEKALDVFKMALKKHPTDQNLLKTAFETALRMEDFAQAEYFIRQYITQNPQDAYSRAHLTTALLYQKKFQDVIQTSKDVFEKDPQNFTAHFNCGVVHFEEKQWKEARAHLESALKTKPNDSFILGALKQISENTAIV